MSARVYPKASTNQTYCQTVNVSVLREPVATAVFGITLIAIPHGQLGPVSPFFARADLVCELAVLVATPGAIGHR